MLTTIMNLRGTANQNPIRGIVYLKKAKIIYYHHPLLGIALICSDQSPPLSR
jgi:hypothetical protein